MAWRGTRQREERGQGMNEGWMDVDLNGMGWDWDDGSKKKLSPPLRQVEVQYRKMSVVL